MHDEQAAEVAMMPGVLRQSVPTLTYIALAFLFLGTAGYHSATGAIDEQPYRDIWQHVAALRALIENPSAPGNPFVASGEISRHYHPLWLGYATLARVLGLTPWQVVSWASYGGMIVMGAGIFAFARSYFRSPWAPVVLLCVLLFGWAFQVEHTGLHSFATLFFGAAYPATYLVGVSLLLWAAIIAGLRRPWLLCLIVPLAAFAFATHQLGAVIGFVGAGALILVQPGGALSVRVWAAVALLGGIGVALFWPYYNPLMLILQPGNSSWDGGPDFYDWRNLVIVLTPAALGIFGLRSAEARALLLALIAYTAIFAIGLTGLQIAGRFLMPMTLVLQIGLAGLLIGLWRDMRITPMQRQIVALLALVAVMGVFLFEVTRQRDLNARISAMAPRPYAAALSLTADIPDDEEVAAFGMAAWPIVAGGQKVIAVPWPEPGIADLAARQALTVSLFDPALSGEARRALAASNGVRVLIADVRSLPSDTLETLAAQSIRTEAKDSFRRFDLFE